jgi:hypothetical protein
MVTVERAMATATKRATWRAMKRVLAIKIAIAGAMGVVGDKESNGKGG